MKSKQAILVVSRQLVEALMPERKAIDCVADKLGVSYDWLVKAMKLPAETRITGVSVSARFMFDQVLIRVEHPEFIETTEGDQLPEVQAEYGQDDNRNGFFLRWVGPAVREVKFREFL